MVKSNLGTVRYQYGKAFQIQSIYNQTQNSQQQNLIAMLTYDTLGRKTETIFNSGAVNEYSYTGLDRINKWEITPYNQQTIEKLFEYDQFDYLSSTGDWEIENDEQGRIRYALGHRVETHHDHDEFGNNIKHEASPSPTPPSSTPPNTMINWSFPPLPNNRIPTQTGDGAETWWQYRENGEASWIGKAPGGDKINLDWDGLGLLKAVSDTSTNARHDFTYAPSGMRIRDKRTGTNQHDRRFTYTTTGALLSVQNTVLENTPKTDIIYANGQAIAEIDHNGNIYELHNDYLGTPRYITNGTPNHQTEGELIGEQAFGPYGEQMIGIFQTGQNTSITLPWGYRPVTGYTGHINEDETGLIYMRGRYYSPLWHRFINSDQGVDPNSLNQYAYVGGMPFMATDPSGMEIWCLILYTTTYSKSTGEILSQTRENTGICWYVGDGRDGGGGGGGGGNPPENNPAQEVRGEHYDDEDCKKLREAGVTKEQFEQLKREWEATENDRTGREYGSFWIGNPSIPGGGPNRQFVPMIPGWNSSGSPMMRPPSFSGEPPDDQLLASSHMHKDYYYPFGDMRRARIATVPGISSPEDRAFTNTPAFRVPSYIGSHINLFVYLPGSTNDIKLMGRGWWNKDCF